MAIIEAEDYCEMWEKPLQKAEMKLLKVMISHSHFNTPFNSHNYVSYPSIVNIVNFFFTTIIVLWYIITRAMQNLEHKLKKDKDTAGFVDYVTPRGSQFFGPVAHPLWCAAVMWWSL